MTVAQVALLPPDTPLRGVAGRIEKLFNREGKGTWRYQNGYLRDERSGTEIRFQLKNWTREFDPALYQGGFIEVAASDDESIVWKKQKGHDLVKLEIMESAQVVRMLSAAEYRANPGGNSSGNAAAAASSAAPVRPAERVQIAEATPFPAPAAAHAVPQADPLVEVQQLGALLTMCGEHAAMIGAGAGEPASAHRATELLFTQAATFGVHRRIDVASFWLGRDAERAARLGFSAEAAPPPLPPHVARVAALIAGDETRERRANKMLRELNHITREQTWRDLTDDKARDILSTQFFEVALAA